jgi:hypothetical protein
MKIFHLIRRSLLSQNKFSKYLLYAIGEIILVVIGILIALQINNWNENSKNLTTQNKYLKKLKADADIMIKIYEKADQLIPLRIKEAEEALIFLNSCGTKEVFKESFESTLVSHQTMMYYEQKSSTYSEMVSNGILSDIQNEELKQAISDLYLEIDFQNSQINYFRDEVGRASLVINTFVEFNYDASYNISVVYDIDSLCKNISFNNALFEIIDARQDWFFGLQRIREYLREVNDLFKNDLIN